MSFKSPIGRSFGHESRERSGDLNGATNYPTSLHSKVNSERLPADQPKHVVLQSKEVDILVYTEELRQEIRTIISDELASLLTKLKDDRPSLVEKMYTAPMQTTEYQREFNTGGISDTSNDAVVLSNKPTISPRGTPSPSETNDALSVNGMSKKIRRDERHIRGDSCARERIWSTLKRGLKTAMSDEPSFRETLKTSKEKHGADGNAPGSFDFDSPYRALPFGVSILYPSQDVVRKVRSFKRTKKTDV